MTKPKPYTGPQWFDRLLWFALFGALLRYVIAWLPIDTSVEWREPDYASPSAKTHTMIEPPDIFDATGRQRESPNGRSRKVRAGEAG